MVNQSLLYPWSANCIREERFIALERSSLSGWKRVGRSLSFRNSFFPRWILWSSIGEKFIFSSNQARPVESGLGEFSSCEPKAVQGWFGLVHFFNGNTGLTRYPLLWLMKESSLERWNERKERSNSSPVDLGRSGSTWPLSYLNARPWR